MIRTTRINLAPFKPALAAAHAAFGLSLVVAFTTAVPFAVAPAAHAQAAAPAAAPARFVGTVTVVSGPVG
jgi:hypothetical protein